MKNNTISVILPVYNVEKYLEKSIKSILNQTFKDFELIIIDDGSTDNCPSICDKYQRLDNRIQVIHQTNKGLSNARNKGIELAIGKYISFIDSDDYIDEKYLEILHSIISKHDADIAICNRIEIREDIPTTNTVNYNYTEEIISKEETYKRMMTNQGITFSAWSKLYKSEIFKNNRYLDGKIYEDVYIINDIIEIANKIVVTNYNGYYYLRRKQSITSSKMNNKQMDLIYSSQKFKDFMVTNYPNLINYVIRGYVTANFTIYNKAILNKEFKNECNSIRNNIIIHKKEILKNNMYSIEKKMQTILLLLGNNIYKLFYFITKRKMLKTRN